MGFFLQKHSSSSFFFSVFFCILFLFPTWLFYCSAPLNLLLFSLPPYLRHLQQTLLWSLHHHYCHSKKLDIETRERKNSLSWSRLALSFFIATCLLKKTTVYLLPSLPDALPHLLSQSRTEFVHEKIIPQQTKMWPKTNQNWPWKLWLFFFYNSPSLSSLPSLSLFI